MLGQEEPGVPMDLAVGAAGWLFVRPKYVMDFAFLGRGKGEDFILEFYFQC